MNVQDDDMLRQMRTVFYYAHFIIVLLTFNWNYLEAFALYFTVVIYELHTKNLHLISCDP